MVLDFGLLHKMPPMMKSIIMGGISVPIGLSARWQTSKKEGKFAEHEFVGVGKRGVNS